MSNEKYTKGLIAGLSMIVAGSPSTAQAIPTLGGSAMFDISGATTLSGNLSGAGGSFGGAETFQFNQFDPGLGTLTSGKLVLEINSSSSKASIDASVAGFDGQSMQASTSVLGQVHSETFSNEGSVRLSSLTPTLANANCVFSQAICQDMSMEVGGATMAMTEISDIFLPFFIGTSTIDFTALLFMDAKRSNSNSALFGATTTDHMGGAIGKISLTYDYEPVAVSVPEPFMPLLISTGLAAMFLRRRYRPRFK